MTGLIKNIINIVSSKTIKPYYMQMKQITLKFTDAEMESGLGGDYPQAVLAHSKLM